VQNASKNYGAEGGAPTGVAKVVNKKAFARPREIG
jgi:hypothetical protein